MDGFHIEQHLKKIAFEEAFVLNDTKPDSALLRDAAELPTRYLITNRNYLLQRLDSYPEAIAGIIKKTKYSIAAK